MSPPGDAQNSGACGARSVEIRAFKEIDWPRMWPFQEDIIRRGDTFSYDPGLSEEQTRVFGSYGIPAEPSWRS